MKRDIPELFVPFHADTETTVSSFEDAVNTLEKIYCVKQVEASLSEIKLNERTVSFEGKDYAATRWAIESLCKICRLSKSTTFGLNSHYLIDLINNIIKVGQESICIFLDWEETRMVNIVKDPYYRAGNKDVLGMFQEFDSEYLWDRKEIRISERGIELSLVTDFFGQIEPVVGDVTKTGLYILNSETGGKPLKASFFLFRLQCLNGAVLRDKWGEVRWTYDKRIPTETSLTIFRRKLQHMKLPIELLQERVSGLLNTRLTDLDFRKIWRNLSRVVSPEGADQILEMTEEERKEILKTLKEREAKRRKSLDPDAKIEPLRLNKNYYEILQLITDKAKDYPFPLKHQLERLGGNLVG